MRETRAERKLEEKAKEPDFFEVPNFTIPELPKIGERTMYAGTSVEMSLPAIQTKTYVGESKRGPTIENLLPIIALTIVLLATAIAFLPTAGFGLVALPHLIPLAVTMQGVFNSLLAFGVFCLVAAVIRSISRRGKGSD